DETSAPRLGIEYRANVDAATILQELLVTFREDGDFTVHREVEVAGGYTAAISEGVWRPFDERLVVGVVALPDRAVVLTGHGPASSEEGGDEEWARLRPLYEGMLQGIAPKSRASEQAQPRQQWRPKHQQTDDHREACRREHRRGGYVFRRARQRMPLRAGEVHYRLNGRVDQFGHPHQRHRQHEQRPAQQVEAQPQP